MHTDYRQVPSDTNHRVLIVDDNDAMRELMVEMLEDENFDIIEASNGPDALRLVDKHTPDLILLDVRMPQMSGFEVCERIRKNFDDSRIAIAMVTGLEDHESIELAFRLGATSFINKPINWNTFPHRIRYILKSRDALAQLKQRETQLSHMDRITRILTQDKHHDTVMHEAMLSILDIFDAERAFIIRTDGEDHNSVLLEYGATQGDHSSISNKSDLVFSHISADIHASDPFPNNPVIIHPGQNKEGSTSHVDQQMLLALNVQQTNSWYLCVQQCHPARHWTQSDSDIFYNLGTRLSDMLSQHLLMEQLHNSERLLKQAQRIGKIGNWHWNAPDDSMSWSAETYRILGFEPDSFKPVFNNCYCVAFDEDLIRLQQLRREATENGKAYEIEYRVRLPDDSLLWVFEQAVCTINASGATTDISGVIQDITDRHRKQEQEAHEKKMESIGQLTSGIAHDFGNLMTIARGNLDILSEILAQNGTTENEADDILEDARSAISDSVELTRQLLSFSRKKSIAPKYVDIETQLGNLNKLLSHSLPSNIELRIQSDQGLPAILVDPVQLESALLNTCINSRNAMPEGGRITISAQITVVDAEQYIYNPMIDIGDTCVTIMIKDDGVGMTEETVNRAIEPFFTTRGGDGTGLGLSMVYGFMRQSRGELLIDSIEDSGTSIRLLFPIYQGATEEYESDESSSPESFNDSTILVVEDQDSVRQFAIRCLGPHDTRILQASDADEAISIIENHDDIDLMFSDIMMPGSMDGRKLAEWVSDNRPAMKILLTTASATQIHINDTGEAPQFSLLPKPYSKQELLSAVQSSLTS